MPNRPGILSLADWACQKEVVPYIGYSKTRPMTIEDSREELEAKIAASTSPGVIVNWDCVAFIKWLYRHSGSRSPDGDVSGALGGNTDTIARHLGHYTKNTEAGVGAIGIYGWPDLPLAGQHAIVCLESHVANPYIASMGSAKGPLRIARAAEDAAHIGTPFFWCNVSHL